MLPQQLTGFGVTEALGERGRAFYVGEEDCAGGTRLGRLAPRRGRLSLIMGMPKAWGRYMVLAMTTATPEFRLATDYEMIGDQHVERRE